MTDKSHGSGNFASSNQTAQLALLDYVRWQSIPFSFENSRLMETDGSGVDSHVQENHFRFSDTRSES